MLTSPGRAARDVATTARHVRVQSSIKTSCAEPDARISHLGGVNPDGTTWLLLQCDAIAAIKQGRWRFYVEDGAGRRKRLILATHLGREYLKTEPDGVQPEGLMSLADSP
jgi:Protein of unknown function (DUF3892)